MRVAGRTCVPSPRRRRPRRHERRVAQYRQVPRLVRRLNAFEAGTASCADPPSEGTPGPSRRVVHERVERCPRIAAVAAAPALQRLLCEPLARSDLPASARASSRLWVGRAVPQPLNHLRSRRTPAQLSAFSAKATSAAPRSAISARAEVQQGEPPRPAREVALDAAPQSARPDPFVAMTSLASRCSRSVDLRAFSATPVPVSTSDAAPEVLDLGASPVRRPSVSPSAGADSRSSIQAQVPVCMAAAPALAVAALEQPLYGELTDRLEHPLAQLTGRPLRRGRGSCRRRDCRVSYVRVADRSAAASRCSRRRRPTSRAKSCCSSGVSSSYDHSMVARSVRCRGSASRPPLNRSSRSPSRSSSWAGVSSPVRAAASSIASGRSSSRAHSSRDELVVARTPGPRARARATNSRRHRRRRHRGHRRTRARPASPKPLAARHQNGRGADRQSSSAPTSRLRHRSRARSCRAEAAAAARRSRPRARRRAPSTSRRGGQDERRIATAAPAAPTRRPSG